MFVVCTVLAQVVLTLRYGLFDCLTAPSLLLRHLSQDIRGDKKKHSVCHWVWQYHRLSSGAWHVFDDPGG